MQTHVILNSNGKTGRRIAERLRESRQRTRQGARPAFDWHEPDTWQRTLEGADTAYLAYTPDLTFPGAPETVGALAARATSLGVGRLVLLSGRGEPQARHAETLLSEAAESHGAEWAVVRCAFFVQNFTEDVFARALDSGVLRFVAGDVLEPFVDADDVAEVATALLLGEIPARQVYELTGPRGITFAEAVGVVGHHLGRQVAYEQVSAATMVDDLVATGLDHASAQGLVALFESVLDGRNSSPAPGVRRALGREARDIAAVAARLAGIGRGAVS